MESVSWTGVRCGVWVKQDLQKKVMIARMMAEIISSVSRKTSGEGNSVRSSGASWRSGCFGRAMSKSSGVCVVLCCVKWFALIWWNDVALKVA